MPKKKRDVRSILRFLARADAIEEYCDKKYVNTHVLIDVPAGEDETADIKGVVLWGSERHMDEMSTELDLDAPIRVRGNCVKVKDKEGNAIELHLFTMLPLNVK